MKHRRTGGRLYCTYFDSSYLARGLVFLRSLRRRDPKARILVLTLDDLCARVLRDQLTDEVMAIETESLHERFPALRTVRRERSLWAYYATQKPALAIFAMETAPEPEGVMYLDADTWFFANPAPIFDELGHASVGLSPHRYHSSVLHFDSFGVFNAGCVYWRNDATGRRCLAEWRDDCLAWCAERTQSDGRFMNQGYLNRWPQRYSNVHILRHPGANLAPWNVDRHALGKDGRSVIVDGQPLIFYHFHGLSRDEHGQWRSHFPHLERQFQFAWQTIYRPYLSVLQNESRRLQRDYGVSGIGTVRSLSDWPVCLWFDAFTPTPRSLLSRAVDILRRGWTA
jgi:hypothetical protein